MSRKKKLRSIKCYINDKEEMINQVFSCIPEKQIKTMTPTTLKDMSIDELKAECLVQLLTMSNERIIRILEGRKDCGTVPEKSENNLIASGTQFVESESEAYLKKISVKDENKIKINQKQVDYSSNTSGSTTLGKRKHKEKKHKSGDKKKRKSSTEVEKNYEESKGRNLLELLELEMRAKAIRSLLKKEEELENVNKQKQEFNEHFSSKKESSPKEKLRHQIKFDDTKIISKQEGTNKVQCKNMNVANATTLKSYFQTIPISEDLKTNKQSNEDEKIKINQKTEKYNTPMEKENNYGWSNTEEEKLIYEDDEYESDEKTENEGKKEEKSEENSRSSWAERWLQSKDVKKVMATSKMLTVVRNKMKNNFKARDKLTFETGSLERLEIEGSVKEYDTLFQMHEAVMADAKIMFAAKR